MCTIRAMEDFIFIYKEPICICAEYASCVGPPEHQGAPLLSNILVSFLNLASGYENENDHLF